MLFQSRRSSSEGPERFHLATSVEVSRGYPARAGAIFVASYLARWNRRRQAPTNPNVPIGRAWRRSIW
jgi:hypothetical protein